MSLGVLCFYMVLSPTVILVSVSDKVGCDHMAGANNLHLLAVEQITLSAVRFCLSLNDFDWFHAS
jgi:hypothetical protein